MKRTIVVKYLSLVIAVCICVFVTTCFAESASDKLAGMYAEAELLMVEGDYAGASEKFEKLGSYSDASQMAMYCKAIDVAENYGMYSVAVDALAKLGDFKDCSQLVQYYAARSNEAAAEVVLTIKTECSKSDLDKAKEMLATSSKGYADLALFKDCLVRMTSCETKTNEINEEIYNRAIELENNAEYDEAIKYFNSSGSFSDSNDHISACNYKKAIQLREKHEWEKAIQLFTKLGNYEDSVEQIKETYYQQAADLIDNGALEKAQEILETISDYKDTKAVMESIKDPIHDARMEAFKSVGSTVTFGHYEQDSSNPGEEKIEWIVLKTDGEKSFLITKDLIMESPYNPHDDKMTWAESEARKYLNETFLSEAFSEKEQAVILLTDVDNSPKQYKDGKTYTKNEKNTKDKIYLLSYTEAWTLFKSDEERTCKPSKKLEAYTDFAVKKIGDRYYGFWYLRTNAREGKGFGCVDYYGKYDTRYAHGWVGVRPVLWVDLTNPDL